MSSNHQLRVLIVGASIAGPAAAYWFAKTGARVTVIERFPQLRTNGQNVDIRGVGVTVMQKIPGMEEAVRAKRAPIHGMSFVDARGHPFATITPTGDPNQQSLVSEYEILRGDLSRILFDLTSANKNVTYVFGEQIASIEPSMKDNNGPVTVTFANGRLPPSPFDLVVACDGAASRTRALGFDCSVRAHMRPTNWWAVYYSLPTDLLPGHTHPVNGHGYSAPGGLAVFSGRDADPAVTRATVMGVHPPPKHPNDPAPADLAAFRAAQQHPSVPSTSTSTTNTRPPSPAASDNATNTATKSFLTTLLTTNPYTSTFHLTPSLLLGMHASTDFHATEIVQLHPPSLSHLPRRVVLVGDAGYAPGPTGAGTSLALAGAYVLAGEVARCLSQGGGVGCGEGGGRSAAERGGENGVADKLEVALRRYEEVMKPVVEEAREVSWVVPAVMAPQSVWGLWVRNWVIWAVCRTGVLGFVQRFVAGAFKKREEERLPEYEWAE